MSPSKSKSSKSSKKSEIHTTNHDKIKEKVYITKEIDTSITLLESSEHGIVLEALLFISKYADAQRNNLTYLQSQGILPKLLALLDHNICIQRVILRLIGQLLEIAPTNLELIDPKNDPATLKVAKFYTLNDLACKEFAIRILAKFAKLGRAEILLEEPKLLKTILACIQSPENDSILVNSLEMFSVIIEIGAFRNHIANESNFKIPMFIQHMSKSDDALEVVLGIFEKLAYFGEEVLQVKLKECNLVEHMFVLIMDPEYAKYTEKCLNVIVHSMSSEKTNTYFIESLKFLEFSEWARKCSENAMPLCTHIFLELAKIDHIRQVLFDLSVEDTILSFLRSNQRKVLIDAMEAISYMSKHKYCCEKMVNPAVIRTILQQLRAEPPNETALATLHYFARRDSRTLYIVSSIDGIGTLLHYLIYDKMSSNSYERLVEMMNMLVTNFQLKQLVLGPELYGPVVDNVYHHCVGVSSRCLEVLVACLVHASFREYYLLKQDYTRLLVLLKETKSELLIRCIVIFLHNAMAYPQISHILVRSHLLPILKQLSDALKVKLPVIGRLIKLIYDTYLPMKFFELGRLELVDQLPNRFYVIDGEWKETFPFLEVLEARQTSTFHTIYVVIYQKCVECMEGDDEPISLASDDGSLSGGAVDNSVNFGFLSDDPYLRHYVVALRKLLVGVSDVKAKVKILANFIDKSMCGPEEGCSNPDKMHHYKLHLSCIKKKLGTNMIPIGYLRLGYHIERAVLFKALADQIRLPCTLVKNRKNKIYWNEVGLIEEEKKVVGKGGTYLRMFVVDLMEIVGRLLKVGSREANVYCDIVRN